MGDELPDGTPSVNRNYLRTGPGNAGLLIKKLNRDGRNPVVEVEIASDDETMNLEEEVYEEESRHVGTGKFYQFLVQYFSPF